MDEQKHKHMFCLPSPSIISLIPLCGFKWAVKAILTQDFQNSLLTAATMNYGLTLVIQMQGSIYLDVYTLRCLLHQTYLKFLLILYSYSFKKSFCESHRDFALYQLNISSWSLKICPDMFLLVRSVDLGSCLFWPLT